MKQPDALEAPLSRSVGDDTLGEIFGTSLELNSEDPAEAKRRRREERFRAAFEHARQTYKAKLDEEAWFFEGASKDDADVVRHAYEMDTKTTQRFGMSFTDQKEACIVYLYYKKHYSAAYDWACALLDRLQVLHQAPSLKWLEQGRVPAPPKQSKLTKSLSNSAVARETLDTALRCMLHAHIPDALWVWSERDRRILLAAFQKIRLGPEEYHGLLVDGHIDEEATKRNQVRARNQRSGHRFQDWP